MIDYISGIIVVCSIMMCVYAIATLNRRRQSEPAHYDERQLLARGTGFRMAFYVVIGLNLFYGLALHEWFTAHGLPVRIAMVLIAFIGLGVHVVYCIFKDAYMYVGQRNRSWAIIICVYIALNACTAVNIFRNSGGLASIDDIFFVNVGIVALFSVILVCVGVKYLLDKRGDVDEES